MEQVHFTKIMTTEVRMVNICGEIKTLQSNIVSEVKTPTPTTSIMHTTLRCLDLVGMGTYLTPELYLLTFCGVCLHQWRQNTPWRKPAQSPTLGQRLDRNLQEPRFLDKFSWQSWLCTEINYVYFSTRLYILKLFMIQFLRNQQNHLLSSGCKMEITSDSFWCTYQRVPLQRKDYCSSAPTWCPDG